MCRATRLTRRSPPSYSIGFPWPRDAAYYIAAPLFHATGLATCALGLALGNRVVMARRFDPEATLKAIADYRVGAVVLVPDHAAAHPRPGTRGAGEARHLIADRAFRCGLFTVTRPVSSYP